MAKVTNDKQSRTNASIHITNETSKYKAKMSQRITKETRRDPRNADYAKHTHAVPYDPIRAHTIPYDPIRSHTITYDPTRSHTIPYDLI